MPRVPRIEFENATYHVMARGNRSEPIVFSDQDRELFVKTLHDACLRSGWKVFAWVLMDDHYHFVLRTPNANLVSGMQWFQNAYTRRLNSRHRLSGPLFGGRYRSILVENEDRGGDVSQDYLKTAIDYVHLNPGRGGMVDGVETSLGDYRWSSIAQGYLLPPTKRPQWLVVDEVLDLYHYPDRTEGRRRFVKRLDEWIADEKGIPELDGISFEARVKRGWFWGTGTFKERMLKLLSKKGKRKSRDYQSSPMERSHTERRANQIVKEGLKHYGQTLRELRGTRRGDWKRSSVAWAITRETTVPHAWISEKLNLSSAANASQQVRRFAKVPDAELPMKERKWKQSRNAG